MSTDPLNPTVLRWDQSTSGSGDTTLIYCTSPDLSQHYEVQLDADDLEILKGMLFDDGKIRDADAPALTWSGFVTRRLDTGRVTLLLEDNRSDEHEDGGALIELNAEEAQQLLERLGDILDDDASWENEVLAGPRAKTSPEGKKYYVSMEDMTADIEEAS